LPGHSPTAERTDELLEAVRSILTDLIGPQNLLGQPIELDTSFDADLEMESIEFVLLTERLQERYGDDIDFVAWLSTKEFEEIVELTVGDLVAFLASSVPPPAS
jgi:acyl carrier protein